MPVPEFTVAGSMTLRCGDLVVDDDGFGGRQLRIVAAMLLLDRQYPVPADRLVHALWPSAPPDQHRVALRGLVSKARHCLAEVGIEGDRIHGRPGLYVVDLPGLRVDLETAGTALSRARALLEAGDLEGAQREAGTARAVLSRPVMSGIDASWVDDVRDRVIHQHLETLLLLGECRRRVGRTSGARTIVREALELAPLREDVWRLGMRVEATGGNASRALDLYEELRHRLAEELGSDPSRDTQDLHARILLEIPDPEDAFVRVAEEGDGRPGQADGRPGAASPVVANPYVGLRSFTSGDADRFFGREAATQEVVNLLARHRAVAVVGASGVGKSSLVRAGLLPALAQGAVPDADVWQVEVITPGHRPLRALAEAVLHARPTVGMDVASLTAAMAADPLALHEFLSSRAGEVPHTTLLVIDQAEQLFTVADPSEAELVLDAVFSAMSSAREPAPRLAAVVAMRADFYGQASSNPRIASLLSRSQYVVAPLRGDGLQSAIAEPARQAGVGLQDGVLGRLVAGTGTNAGSLPLVQHVLWELWEHRQDGQLTLAALDRLGGVSGALARHAEETWRRLDAPGRSIARRLLLRAVTPSKGEATAAPVPKADLYGLFPDDDVDGVVSVLVEARLLTSSGGPVDTSADGQAPVVELAHEALLREWPRLRGWIDDERETLLLARRIRDLAADWEAAARDASHLLRGARLEQAEQHGRLLDVALTDTETGFVMASLRARANEEDAQRRRRAITQARKLAVEARTTKIEDPERSTLLALESVRHSRGQGLVPEPEAVGALHEAVQASRVVRRFSGGSCHVTVSPDGNWMAVDERLESTNPVVVDLATGSRSVLPGPPNPGAPPAQHAIHRLKANPGGTQLAVGYEHGPASSQEPGGEAAGPRLPPVVVFDVASGRACHELDGPPGTYWSLSYSPDGSLVAAAIGTNVVVVWETATHERIATHEVNRDIWEVAFVPTDGDLLVGSSDPQGLVRMDPCTGERLGFFDLPRWGGYLMAPDPLGRYVALTYLFMRRVVVRELPTGQVVHDWPTPSPLCAAWSPDGSTIAYSGSRGTTTVRDVATGAKVCELAGNTTVRDLAFLPDGRHLASPNRVGGIGIWDVSRAGPPRLEAIAAETGSIDNFWLDREHACLAISTFEPPCFELIDATTGGRLASLRLVADSRDPMVDLDDLTAVASPDVTCVATLESNGRSALRRLPDLEVLTEFETGGLPVAVSERGALVALNTATQEVPVADDDWTFQVWDPRAATLVLACEHFANAAAFARHAPGRPRLVAISTYVAGLCVYDLDSTDIVASFMPGERDITEHLCVAFSPDGRFLAGGSELGQAWVADLSAVLAGSSLSDAIVFQQASHTGALPTAVITDAGLLATGGYDGHVRVWDIHVESLVAEFSVDLAPAQIPVLRLSPDQDALLYVESGDVIRRFPLDVDDLVRIAEDSVTRPLTTAERRRHGLADQDQEATR